MAEKLYLTAGSWSVTAGAVTTPRRTFRLEHVQALHLSKPLFIFSAIGASLVGFHLAAFHDVLTQTEMAGVGLVTMLVVAACSQFGRLTITAAGPRGEFSDEMLGWWPRLRRVRQAIDQALDERLV